LLWAARRAVEDPSFALVNSLDGYAGLRNALRAIAMVDGSWAGIPMPIDGHRLVIEPKFPRAEGLMKIGEPEMSRDLPDSADMEIVGTFQSIVLRCTVVLYRGHDGKVRHYLYRPNPIDRLISMMDCSYAWGIEQEANAVQTLDTLLRHVQFKMYMLTGAFLETSRRTGLHYIFRRLRPTVVLGPCRKRPNSLSIRTTLCMHPIGYYEDTWAGAMAPTDDVIAHLMLMRGDEPMFWRRSNQHPAWDPNAGVAG